MVKLIRPNKLYRLDGKSVPLLPKQTDVHYFTKEHLVWAAAVKARAGHACERCGRNEVRMFADHIVELKDGGLPFALSNGQCLCGSCHTWKTVRSGRARRQKEC